jgi:hypothetical protein
MEIIVVRRTNGIKCLANHIKFNSKASDKIMFWEFEKGATIFPIFMQMVIPNANGFGSIRRTLHARMTNGMKIMATLTSSTIEEKIIPVTHKK